MGRGWGYVTHFKFRGPNNILEAATVIHPGSAKARVVKFYKCVFSTKTLKMLTAC